MAKYFVDTNFFIQFNHSANLPWRQISADDIVEIIVCRPVSSEIDKHKVSPSQRLRERAKATVSHFRQALEADDLSVTIKERGPKVILRLDNSKIENPEATPDNQIARCVQNYMDRNPDDSIILITDDTDLRLTAKGAGLRTFAPPDEWRRPPEADPRDIELKELKKQLQVLTNTIPVVGVRLESEAQPVVSGTEIFLSKSDPVNLEKLAKLLKRTVPRAHLNASYVFFGPGENVIADYNDDYDRWFENAKKWIAAEAEGIEKRQRSFPATIWIDNTGTVPMLDTIVELYGDNGIRLLPQNWQEEEKRSQKFPRPPKEPIGPIYSSIFDRFPGIADVANFIPKSEDRKLADDELHPKHNLTLEPQIKLVFGCKSLPHQVGGRRIDVYILFPQTEISIITLIAMVYASNMPMPQTFSFQLSFLLKKQDMESALISSINAALEKSRS